MLIDYVTRLTEDIRRPSRLGEVRRMKSFDLISFGLLLVGGLNRGLMGFFGFDLVAAILGSMSFLNRIVYALVGLAAVYEISQIRVVRSGWTEAEAR